MRVLTVNPCQCCHAPVSRAFTKLGCASGIGYGKTYSWSAESVSEVVNSKQHKIWVARCTTILYNSDLQPTNVVLPTHAALAPNGSREAAIERFSSALRFQSEQLNKGQTPRA